jgi:hypothetical protein
VPLTATTILTHTKTRDDLLAFILRELPGWQPWLTLAAADIQSSAWDDHLLKSTAELTSDIQAFASEFVKDVGPERAERFFRPFTQQRPNYDALATNLPASEAFTRAPNEMPFSHADLGDKLPSRALIGLLGALGLRQQETRAGKKENWRMTRALEWVHRDLMPFVKADAHVGAKVGEPVAPEESQRDPALPLESYSRAPLTRTLAAVVAIYLSLPNRTDPDAGTDPNQLILAPSALSEALRRLRASAPATEAAPWADFDLERELALDTIPPAKSSAGNIDPQIPPVTTSLHEPKVDESDGPSLRKPRS